MKYEVLCCMDGVCLGDYWEGLDSMKIVSF